MNYYFYQIMKFKREIPIKFIANYQENDNIFDKFAIISKKDDSNLLLSVAKERNDLLFCRTYGIQSNKIILLKTENGEMFPEKHLLDEYQFDHIEDTIILKNQSDIKSYDLKDVMLNTSNLKKVNDMNLSDLHLFDSDSSKTEMDIIDYDIDENFFSIIFKDEGSAYYKSIKKNIYQIIDKVFNLDSSINGRIVNQYIEPKANWLILKN